MTAPPSGPPTAPDPSTIGDVSMTAVPGDVLVPTSPASLDPVTNPINGRRTGARARPGEPACAEADGAPCVTLLLDRLGFDVVGGDTGDPDGATDADDPDVTARRLAQAITVVQLDAGLAPTGVADAALLDHLSLVTAALSADDAVTAGADERRTIGTSQQGRPLVALRYGSGSRVALVVGQTHGDEEAGLRVLARALALDLPDDVTLWVVPTLNPDGWANDTRFLADGADPNRHAPSLPEQVAVFDFAMAIQPSLSIWYHQNYGWVGGSGASFGPARHYQALTSLGTLKRSGDCATRGFMWCPIDEALGGSSILVELTDVVTPADVQLHAQALLDVIAADT